MIKIKELVIKLLRPFIKIINHLFLRVYYKSNKTTRDIKESEIVLVFAPHMDDETIGLGGTIKQHDNANSEIHCVFITDGTQSVSELNKEKLSNVRKQEVKNVAPILGLDKLYFMDLPDGNVKVDIKHEEEISRFIKQINPDIIYIPSFIDAHPDHIATAELVTNALVNSDKNNSIIRLYEINCAIPPRYINCVIDTSNTFPEKLKAIKEFKSQVIHFEGFIKLSKLKVNLLHHGAQIKTVETFIQLTLVELIKHKNLILETDLNFYKEFKQINREETLLWAIYKGRATKDKLYDTTLKFVQTEPKVEKS